MACIPTCANIPSRSGTSTSTEAFTVLVPPAIAAFSPMSALPGDTVVVEGVGFSATAAENQVLFLGAEGEADDLPATVTSASETRLEVTVPEGVAEGPVRVTVRDLSATSERSFTLYVPFSIETTTQPLRLGQTSGMSVRLFGSGLSESVSDYEVSATPAFGGTPVALEVVRYVSGFLQVGLPEMAGLYRIAATFEGETATGDHLVQVYDFAYVHSVWNGVTRGEPLDRADDAQALQLGFGPNNQISGTYTIELLDPDTGVVRYSHRANGSSGSSNGTFGVRVNPYTGPIGTFRARFTFVPSAGEANPRVAVPTADTLTVIDSRH